ncbi:MAG: SDR family NAD(P)-dependent oxidoreductase [Anaerolineae bacterium]|nr:SDR family NAD(P)-dependent oxidoreductase [Anaerolineae bacterium]
MNVLLTGAFGNVGTSAIGELLKQGHRVRCFDLKTKPNEKKALKYGDRIEVVWGDLRNPDDVAAAVCDQDVVVHLAFIIPKLSATGFESEDRPDWAREINVGGTRNLIAAMQALPHPPRLIFSSSYHVYGQTHDQPPPRTVCDPVDPIEHYACHKVECEQMVRESGLEWAILRFAAVLPLSLRLDPGMYDVPPDNRMEYVHTRDVGLAVANAVSSDEIWGRLWLIGGGPRCQYTYREILQKILGSMGVGMLPEEVFTTVPFPTDWIDTAESQRVLQYQQRDLDDYVQELTKLMGVKRHLIRLFRPIVRAFLLRRSPYLRARRNPDWQGKVAVVTGASSGIGEAIARKFSREGLRVVLVARSRERLEHVAKQLRALGGEALVIVADLTQEEERLQVFEEVRTAYGSVDVLVNNAGFGWYGFGAEMPWSLAWQMLQINVAAVVRLTLLFLEDMKAHGRGHVINVGSIASSLPAQGIALYSATKSFVESFTTSLYRELRDTGVRISLVKPGAVATEFFKKASAQLAALRMPGGELNVKPETVADRVWKLLKRPARVAYVPRLLSLVAWVEPFFGWLIDRLGPLLLRRQRKLAPVRVRNRPGRS